MASLVNQEDLGCQALTDRDANLVSNEHFCDEDTFSKDVLGMCQAYFECN